MATVVNVHEAKTQLSKLLVEVANGTEIVIARNGTPCARLLAIPARQPRLGTMRNSWPPLDIDFFAPLDEDELADWHS